MHRTHGWGPAHGASRPPRAAPRLTSLGAARVDRAAWCMPSPRARTLRTNRLDGAARSAAADRRDHVHVRTLVDRRVERCPLLVDVDVDVPPQRGARLAEP